MPKVNNIYLFAAPLALNNLAKQYPRNGIKDQINITTIENNIAENETLASNNLIIKGGR